MLSLSVSRIFSCAPVRVNTYVQGALHLSHTRHSSNSSKSDNTSGTKVALSPDGSTYLCWHPEQTYPYEHSKPLPRKEAELSEGDSVLKIQHLEDERNRFRPDGPTNKELQKIFFTTRHTWDPKPSKRWKKNTPKDRESL